MSASPGLWAAAEAATESLKRSFAEQLHRSSVVWNQLQGIEPADSREWTFADHLRIRGHHATGWPDLAARVAEDRTTDVYESDEWPNEEWDSLGWAYVVESIGRRLDR